MLLVFLQLVGVLTPQTLLKGWRYAIVVIFVIAAVITPSGDPYSMLALAIPMSLFYMHLDRDRAASSRSGSAPREAAAG